MSELCKHCNMPVEIRNPSGYCDHLYYPDYCKICQKIQSNEKVIKTKIKKLEKLIKEIKDDAPKTKYTSNDCPLRHNHYKLSQIFSGLGTYGWECIFCGEEYSE